MAKSLNELRKLQRSQLNSMKKDELIESILSFTEAGDGSLQTVIQKLTELTEEIATIKTSLASQHADMKTKVDELQKQVDKQGEVIARQQRYLEYIDRKERECNLVVLGVPEEAESLDGATTDPDKIDKVWRAAGIESNVLSVRRLGRTSDGGAGQRGTRRRPILVSVQTKEVRDMALEKAKTLKEKGERYNKIYIKKDIHPSIRGEWKRLWEAERKEKERPENTGCHVFFNVRERKLYRDGVVIDQWNLQGF